jgi:hypothetical protein
MSGDPKYKRAALRRAINRYRDAAISDSWKGGGHPDYYAEIEYELEQSEAALVALIKRYLP